MDTITNKGQGLEIKAKELLWELLEPNSKELMLYMTLNNEFKVSDKLIVGFMGSNSRTLLRDDNSEAHSPINRQ